MKVLVIDDDHDLAQAMRKVLKSYSVELDAAHTPEDGLKLLREGEYDLLLLDIMLPNINGFEVCRRVRSAAGGYKNIPIIMLTARSDLTDLVVGLEMGADDYVTKPFEPRELVARIHAVKRRFWSRAEAEADGPPPAAHDGPAVRFQLDGASLLIEPANARVLIDQQPLSLTSMEYELLLFLSKEAGQVFSREDLIMAMQGVTHLSQRSVDALVYRLRIKMRAANLKATFIRTVRNRGYSLIGQRLAALQPEAAAGMAT